MSYSFSKLPTWWIHNSQTNKLVPTEISLLQNIFTSHGNKIGENIAALKCYLVLISYIEFKTGKSKVTYSKIEDIAGLSRPMICKGLKILQAVDLINFNRVGRQNVYQIKLDFEGFNIWAKAPKNIIYKYLSNIPSRGIIPLVSLKIYLLFLSIRDRNQQEVFTSYEFLEKNCSIQRKYIRKALVLLAVGGFIEITKIPTHDNKYLHNSFTLNGISIDGN